MADTTAPRASAHDLELVALAAAGGRAAFGELVRRHGSAVRGLLRRMGAQAALADDLAQDALLAAFEQIGEFRGDGTFQAWVKRIAARLYVKRWRKDARLELMAEPPEIEAATIRNALLVPNAALRFVPPEDVKKSAPPAPPTLNGLNGGRVWTENGKTLKPHDIRLGATNGRSTQVLTGDLKVGDEVVTDLADKPAKQPGS